MRTRFSDTDADLTEIALQSALAYCKLVRKISAILGSAAATEFAKSEAKALLMFRRADLEGKLLLAGVTCNDDDTAYDVTQLPIGFYGEKRPETKRVSAQQISEQTSPQRSPKC